MFVHPIVRYALAISNYPLFFAALVGLVSLPSSAGLLETFGFLLFTAALSAGPVVFVSPIIATTPMWVLLGTTLILRDAEHLNYRTVLGTCSVTAGTAAISLGA